MGESTDGGNKSGYEAAIAELRLIAGMPDANVTPEQNAEWSSAQKALDRFFRVPDTAPDACDLGSHTAAAAAWSEEPANTISGVIVGPLKLAVADLQPGAARNPCYIAAIDDLTDLESATKSTIAQSYTQPCDFSVVGYEVAYLDALFQEAVLTAPGECSA
ncbi:MAG TPA: hypothetical protein VFZ97_18420 [Acidimicrobiales bacterium]